MEHIDNIQDHLKKISELLSNKGRLIFSLPDFDKWITGLATNAFSQEHPIYPTLENLSTTLEMNRFKINRIYEFENHSIFIDAIFDVENSQPTNKFLSKDVYLKNQKMVKRFFDNFKKFGINLRGKIGESETYIFGANSGTQLLLKNFLNDAKIVGILDNSNLKNGKLLYGFKYNVQKPDILKNQQDLENMKLVICTGKYVQEIKEQITKINKKIQILTNEDIMN